MGASTALDPRLGNGGVTWHKLWVEGQAWGILPWRGPGQIVKLPQSSETPPVQILVVAGCCCPRAGRVVCGHLPQSTRCME